MFSGMDYRYYYETLGTAHVRCERSALIVPMAATVGVLALTGSRLLDASGVVAASAASIAMLLTAAAMNLRRSA